MKKTLLTTVKTSTILIGGALMAQAAWASGYHFGTQSVSSQATANSSAAEAADPSTLFYNPAGLTKLEGTQATVNVNLVAPSVKYSGASAEYPAVPLSATTTYPKEKVQGQDELRGQDQRTLRGVSGRGRDREKRSLHQKHEDRRAAAALRFGRHHARDTGD